MAACLFLKNVPFSASGQRISAEHAEDGLTIKPFQIIVWVSLSQRDVAILPADAPRLAALLDIGHNHTFSINHQHLLASDLPEPYEWSKSPLRVRDASGAEREVPRLVADLWIHSNLPRLGKKPYHVKLNGHGIACEPATSGRPGPRLPLLGLAALCLGSISIRMKTNPSGGTLDLYVPA